jgi:DNA-binding transcriptional MerR regulator
MNQPVPSLSIGQVAELTGLSVYTLRFYEREGVLLDPVRRGVNGRRLYSEADVEWLADCVRLRASGMPLAEIRQFADLTRQGAGYEGHRLAILRQHQVRVTAQIAELTECLNLVNYKISVYEHRLRDGTTD